MIDSNPCTGVKLPSLTYKKGSAYSEDEAAEMLQLLEKDASYENQLIVKLAIVTGCREGEIAALEAKHLDGKSNLIRVEQSLPLIKTN
ncbi:hypothetical protein [Sporosarcina sp. Te-1]|uniref:hypothetical protein n=1 Tax=Sporosarcina sp. Te-1 TaxID=2818390 RepID=UPI001A9D268C|nr:hypothetical protein [Sporosarcina sp. Te-1]QTD41943.1 hypothetical protein J3U78_03580 [Sporosarcina sp. Te-1]